MADDTLRYIQTDVQSHKDALIQRIRSRWPTVWNDFLANSFGMVLIDVIAWSTSMLAYTINRLAGEFFVDTMTLHESAVRLGAFTGYQLRGPVPSTVSCELSLTSPATDNIFIKAGTLVRAGSLPFEVTSDYTIFKGATSPSTLIATLDPSRSGPGVFSTNLVVTGGSSYLDCVDSSTDLSQVVQPGMVFSSDSITSGTIYVVQSVGSSPGAVSFNRLVISPVWAEISTGAMDEITGRVSEQRIALVQGQTVTDRFKAPATTISSYFIKLSRSPVIAGSVGVEINGETWTPVASVQVEAGSSRVYQVKATATGETLVQFGDGQFGAAVPTDASLLVTYRVGGGSIGNLAVGAVYTNVTGTLGSSGIIVSLPIRNATSAGQGGRDPETLAEARVNIPAYTRTNDRAVTIADYQTLAQSYSSPQYGSVTYARAGVRTDNALLEGNIVLIYAWATGSTGLVPLTPALKAALTTYLQTKAVGTDYVIVADGTSRPAPISLRFKCLNGFAVPATAQLVSDQLKAFIASLTPGSSIVHSDLVRLLDSVYGVDSIIMSTPIANLDPSNATELFTTPDDTYVYSLARMASDTELTSQLPMAPVDAWSLAISLDDAELTIVPSDTPGEAWLLGPGVTGDSVINLLTGVVTWHSTSSSELQLSLKAVQGYDRERPVDLYIGYTGGDSTTVTVTKRQEVRAALRNWSNNLGVGATLYAGDLTNSTGYFALTGITASKSNVAAVVAKCIGSSATITRVALGSPSSTETRINAMSNELLRVGSIYINNQSL